MTTSPPWPPSPLGHRQRPPLHPRHATSFLAVGNEVLNSGDPTIADQLLLAMENLAAPVPSSNIKVSTVNTVAVLAPPLSAFPLRSYLEPQRNEPIPHQDQIPLYYQPYMYFACRDDPRIETQAFCLFQPNSGRFDAGSKITCLNMFDIQLDAVKSALKGLGFPESEIVVAETESPYRTTSERSVRRWRMRGPSS